MQASVVFNNQGGTVNTAPGSKNAIGLSGINTFTAGTISPGGSNAIGSTTITAVAPVTSPMALNNTIRLQVNGDKTAGTDFDKVSGTGGLSFDISGATLEVTSIFTPTKKADTILIMSPGGGATQGTINGTFASVSGLTPGWSVYYASTGVRLVYNAALPVKLFNFNATPLNGMNRLVWQTVTESNNKGFFIQRQNNDGRWINLGFVVAKGSESKYIFTDNEPLVNSYYRLKQVDINGTECFSQVVRVNKNVSFKITMLPNPTTDKVYITLPLNENLMNKSEISVYNFSGKQVLTKQATSNIVDVDFSNLAKGTYIVKVVVNNNIYSEKVVRQ
jgi:hypothetical protein